MTLTTEQCEAPFLLGHANLGTTETYLARPRLEDLAAAVKGFTYGIAAEQTF